MSSRHSGSSAAIRWLNGALKNHDYSHEFLGRRMLTSKNRWPIGRLLKAPVDADRRVQNP
jgi:hypothetical protein